MSAQSIPIRGSYPQPPKHLLDDGRVAWESGLKLWQEGSLIERDLPAWTIYCEWWDRRAKYIADLSDEEGAGEFQVTQNGTLIAHPAIRLLEKVEQNLTKYSVLFKLVPSARAGQQQFKTNTVSQRKRS